VDFRDIPGPEFRMAECPFKFGLHLLSTLRCIRIDWGKIPKGCYILDEAKN
jgi:hypothetical protein